MDWRSGRQGSSPGDALLGHRTPHGQQRAMATTTSILVCSSHHNSYCYSPTIMQKYDYIPFDLSTNTPTSIKPLPFPAQTIEQAMTCFAMHQCNRRKDRQSDRHNWRSTVKKLAYCYNAVNTSTAIIIIIIITRSVWCSMIGSWHHDVVCPSVCLSVCPSDCNAVHYGAQGWCRGLKVAPWCF